VTALWLAGLAVDLNDLFLVRPGVRGGRHTPLNDQAALEFSVSGFPDLHGHDWTARTRWAVEDYEVAPDLSRIRADGRAVLWVQAAHAGVGATRSTLDLYAGGGLVYTVDDTTHFQATDPDEVRELHAASIVGFAVTGWRDGHALRVRLEGMLYEETNSGTDRDKSVVLIGLEWLAP